MIIVKNLFVKIVFLIQKKSCLQHVNENKRNDASDSDDNMVTDDEDDDDCYSRLISNDTKSKKNQIEMR